MKIYNVKVKSLIDNKIREIVTPEDDLKLNLNNPDVKIIKYKLIKKEAK